MTISAYPIQWPTGWRRTIPAQRVDARFSRGRRHQFGDTYTPARALTITEGVERVILELQRMGVLRDDLVISSNLQVRLDGLPRSSQAEPDDPGVAVYWQEALGGRRVMAIDIYNRVADNLAAVAATLGAMRAIERHGGAAVLERAFTGFVALPAPIIAGMKRHWREVLEFPPQAVVTEPMVSARFRSMAFEHHPDRGGDGSKMAELNQARDEALQEVR